ncbi:VOC family protein, partial [Nocardia farcinica]|uniref:VOC family protein n=1 Tax=Nocardia farcinica TaxID=37329 RepID=UPI00313B5B3C
MRITSVVRRAAEHGARSVDEPQTFLSGDRFAAVLDPFGHRWVVISCQPRFSSPTSMFAGTRT